MEIVSLKNKNINDITDIHWPRGCHPVEQARLWLGELPLYDWQIDILIAAAEPHSRVAMSSCNLAGKTSTIGLVFLLSVMAAFRGARCYATSGNEEQLIDTLYALLQSRAEELKAQGYAWEAHVSSLRITSSNGSTCILSVKRDPKSVEGRHGYERLDPVSGERYYSPLAYFVDEAKHVHNETEKAIRRIDPDFLFVTSTPPEETEAEKDWFWKGAINIDKLERIIRKRKLELGINPDKKDRDVFTRQCSSILAPDLIHSFPGEYWTYRRVIDWLDIPHLQTPARIQERKNIEKKFGKKSAFVRSTLYGIGSEGAAENRIFAEEEVEAMRKAMTPNSEFKAHPGETRSAADVSGTADGDPMVLGVRNGTEVLYIEEKSGLDDVGQAEYLNAFNRSLELAPYQFIIDAGGIGAAVGNRIEQTLKYHGITRFQANHDPTFDYQFFDRYTELHWVIKELLSYKAFVCPWCPNLLRDMRERRYVEMSGAGGGRIKMEDKRAHRKRVGHSPDCLDMLVYLFSDFPMNRIRRGLSLRREKPEAERRSGKIQFRGFEKRQRVSRIMPGLIKQPSLAEIMMARNKKLSFSS